MCNAGRCWFTARRLTPNTERRCKVAEPMIAEEWRPVVGYEGAYSVSNIGNVRNDRRGRPVRPAVVKLYLKLSLSRNDVRKQYFVHSLVAAAFIGPRPIGHVTNHKDGNKFNNTPENLEYCTVGENNRHSIDVLGNSLRGSCNPNAKLAARHVVSIRKRLASGASLASLARAFGVTDAQIRNIRDRISWSHIP